MSRLILGQEVLSIISASPDLVWKWPVYFGHNEVLDAEISTISLVLSGKPINHGDVEIRNYLIVITEPIDKIRETIHIHLDQEILYGENRLFSDNWVTIRDFKASGKWIVGDRMLPLIN